MRDIIIDNKPTGYLIDKSGRVFTTKRNRFMDPGVGSNGYVNVRIRLGGGKYVMKLVHVLVMEAFVGPSNGMDVNHKDGDKSNNNLGNLEYSTRSENIKHSYRTGLHTKVKITDEQIPEIRKSGLTGRELSKIYNVSEGMISLIKNHKVRI